MFSLILFEECGKQEIRENRRNVKLQNSFVDLYPFLSDNKLHRICQSWIITLSPFILHVKLPLQNQDRCRKWTCKDPWRISSPSCNVCATCCCCPSRTTLSLLSDSNKSLPFKQPCPQSQTFQRVSSIFLCNFTLSTSWNRLLAIRDQVVDRTWSRSRLLRCCWSRRRVARRLACARAKRRRHQTAKRVERNPSLRFAGRKGGVQWWWQ